MSENQNNFDFGPHKEVCDNLGLSDAQSVYWSALRTSGVVSYYESLEGALANQLRKHGLFLAPGEYTVSRLLSQIKELYGDNSYHNYNHALLVAHNAVQCFLLSNTENYNSKELVTLILAALLHDADHTGGQYDDRVNVARAISAAVNLIEVNKLTAMVDLPLLTHAITETMFVNGAFVFDSASSPLVVQCLRDADLMGFMSPFFPEIVTRLNTELGFTPGSDNYLTMVKNLKWLENSCYFYTRYGRQCRQQLLALNGLYKSQNTDWTI